MSVSRIKSMVIVALLLVNAFFLGIIIIDTYADAQNERQALQNVCSVLRSNGIAINPENIKDSEVLSTMRTAREVESEAIIAEALLGQVEMSDQSVIYLYENTEKGTAEFYSGGDFYIQLHEGVIPNSDGSVATVREILRNMKLETTAATVIVETEAETVAVLGTYRGTSVFNCTIDFVFSGGNLKTVKGRYLTGIEPVLDGADLSNVSTALLEFLAVVKRGDIRCYEIRSVEAGYMHDVVGSFGEGIITPVWLLTTDSGRYVVDSATGEVRTI